MLLLNVTEHYMEDRAKGRDRFATSGRGIRYAGRRIVSHETIDQTETGRKWLTMFPSSSSAAGKISKRLIGL